MLDENTEPKPLTLITGPTSAPPPVIKWTGPAPAASVRTHPPTFDQLMLAVFSSGREASLTSSSHASLVTLW